MQTASKTLAQKAIAAGMPGIQVDGNDIIAMRQTMEESLERARSGNGPMLVEAVTYRLSDHTTADDASRYREKGEVEDAWKIEPMIRIRRYLMETGALSEQDEEALKAECTQQVDAAVAAYLDTPVQPVEAMFDSMFAELPEAMVEQRETARRFVNSGGHH
jgi:2-oxoisovalerate dehydrogenase E1 component alpha subunit